MVLEALEGVEASLLPYSPRLQRRFADPGLEPAWVGYLVERIRRNPRDLRAHVERVLVRLSRRERAELLAALVDLNIALGAGGRGLRARLLDRAAPWLEGDALVLLRGGLERGLAASDERAAVPGACLARPVGGSLQLVRRAAGGPDDAAGPLQLAREALAAGDEQGAQCLLEAAIEQDPGQAELGQELLALYRRNGRHEDFQRTRTGLLGRRVAGAADWDQLEGLLAGAPRRPPP